MKVKGLAFEFKSNNTDHVSFRISQSDKGVLYFATYP